MKRIAAFLTLLALPALNQAAGAYPFGANVNYAFGVKPNPASGSWATDNTTIQNLYNSWKAAHVISAGGAQLRVQRDAANSNDTVSEGISYGMLLAVYFDDKVTFDGLWAYKQAHSDG